MRSISHASSTEGSSSTAPADRDYYPGDAAERDEQIVVCCAGQSTGPRSLGGAGQHTASGASGGRDVMVTAAPPGSMPRAWRLYAAVLSVMLGSVVLRLIRRQGGRSAVRRARNESAGA